MVCKLLFIAEGGKIYYIPTTLKLSLRNETENKTLYNTVIDGEHILRDKTGGYLDKCGF